MDVGCIAKNTCGMSRFLANVLLLWALLAISCAGSDRVGEDAYERYAEENRAVAATLPVPERVRLIEEKQVDCSGAFKYEASAACVLSQKYETADISLHDVKTFYDDYFGTAGWDLLDPPAPLYLDQSYLDGDRKVRLSLIAGVACGDEDFDTCAQRQLHSNAAPMTFFLRIGPG